MRVLLTGGSGQIGGELRRAAPPDWSIHAPGRNELDLGDPQTIKSMVHREKWDLIVNAGAYTAVDHAESDVATAWRINAVGVSALANQAALKSIPLIHLSTDYVFDGTKAEPYREGDPICPIGVYGASKAAGELAVSAAGGHSLILRTAWVVSAFGNNFVKTMLRLASEGKKLKVVDDQRGCPSSAKDLAAAIAHLAPAFLAREGTQLYHLVNGGEATWHEVALQVFESSRTFGRTVPHVDAIPTSEYPTAVRRPANSRLSIEKIGRDYHVTMRNWREAIDDIVRQLLSGEAGSNR